MIATYTSRKPYSISFENRKEYLLAKIEGKVASLQVSRQYWEDIVQEATRIQPTRLLVWEDFGDMLNTMDTYLLLKELCQLKQFLHLRIAFVDEHRDQLLRNKLGEMIASNSGFTCRVFTDFGEAEKWLLAG